MGGGRVLNRFVKGVGFALRSGAAPIVVGARLASRRWAEAPVGLPEPRRGLAMASKIALDEFFFATELAAAPLVRVRDRARLT